MLNLVPFFDEYNCHHQYPLCIPLVSYMASLGSDLQRYG